MGETDKMLFLLVPEVGIEPTRAQGPEDFESSASTSFTTPAKVRLKHTKGSFCCQQNYGHIAQRPQNLDMS